MAEISHSLGLTDNLCSERRLRVFISYSHEDADAMLAIAEVLKNNGMVPFYDQKDLQVGTGFRQEIMNFIAHAQVFLPLLTEVSIERRWVQQEIGYAVALRVPTVPVVICCEPGEFLHGIEAIRLRSVDSGELEKRLTRKALEGCVQRRPLGGPLYECAATTEERAVLMAEYANAVTAMGGTGLVRQLGGLSSFHIPAETIDHELWRLRYGKRTQSEYHRKVLWEERLALTRHAEKEGCRILVDPKLGYSFYGGQARRVRLQSLLNFLLSMPNELCSVALAEHELAESTTIVGDWFAAHSIYGREGEGYRQTNFTRHAPTVAKMIDEFDRRFSQHLKGLPPEESRDRAIFEIQRELDDIGAVRPDRSKRGKTD